VRLEGSGELKNSMTSSGTERAVPEATTLPRAPLAAHRLRTKESGCWAEVELWTVWSQCSGAHTRLTPVHRIMTLPTFLFVAETTAGGS
jgi:hypothetical protein